MSLASVVHGVLRPARAIKHFRHKSFSAKAQNHDPSAVPPEKMRALITLYHKSEDFVTHENLSMRIDQAFLGTKTMQKTLPIHDNRAKLQEQLDERRKMPRIGVVDAPSRSGKSTPDGNWSSSLRNARELAVESALFGMHEEHKEKPGLEALEEEGSNVQQQLREDRQAM
jgi:hypothetical protein